jgi:hypothetical protein
VNSAEALVVAIAVDAVVLVILAKLGWTPLRIFNAIEDGLRWLVTPRQTREQRIAELERELGIGP